MKQEGEVKYCYISRNVFAKYFEKNYNDIKEKLPLLEILDPNAIHDIRVLSRRNRALFSESKQYLPKEIADEYLEENKKITRLLGKRRELDVLLQIFTSIKKTTPIIISDHLYEIFSNYVEEKRKEEEPNCIQAKEILSTRLLKIINPFYYSKVSEKYCIYEHSKKRINNTLKKLKEEYKKIIKIDDPMNEEIHQFRILLKKTRYMFEIYKEIYGHTIVRWLKLLKEAQNYLGLWNDCRILLTLINKLHKEKNNKNFPDCDTIKNYIYGILLEKLRDIQNEMEQNLHNNIIFETRVDVKRLCKLHKCIDK